MPNSANACDVEKKRKILGLNADFMKNAGKFMAWVLIAAVAIISFYFVSEAQQEQRISDNKTKMEKTEERVSNHIRHAAETFARSSKILEKFDNTMTEQRVLIRETREVLIGLSSTQREIKRENGRLAKSVEVLAAEVRKRNGAMP